ncbi:hypothetical protein D3C85_1068290 [compost metagenome]
MCVISTSSPALGLSSSSAQARATSRALWGGMSVAMPTAIPVTPLSRMWGRRAGSTTGSFMVPSKFGVHSTVPWPSSESSSSEKRDSRASV